ncbi:MAG TPA: TRAP transporter large permease [Burkholderiaceae bacterium]|nr:TRAP transporter large permease [Burkholderiaceae bacterium]
MSPLIIALLLFVLMLGLMAIRVPIAAAMFVAGVVGYLWLSGWQPLIAHLKNYAYGRFSSYDLSVIPLFMLMGQFATQGGLSKSLFAFANALLGNFKGGMAMAAVVACALFGSVCGSSIATAATIGSVALPEMKRHGYSGKLATATVAAGGTLGILIPPSVVLVVYAILTEQNIAKLFAAAFVPGILAMVGYVIAVAIYVRVVPGLAPDKTSTERGHLLQSAVGVWPIAAIFLIVFGGIYGGVFTPTEGAAVGAAATFLTALIRRELSWKGFVQSFYLTAEASGMIFMIFVGADTLNSALTLTQAPNQLAAWVTGMGLAPLAVIVVILVFYVVLGCVMDELSMILLTIPIFFPLIMALDLGLPPSEKAIWFGILVLMVVEIGLIAPPVGLNVYVINGIERETPIADTYRGVMPFLISDFLRTALLLLFPVLSLYLVRMMD